MSIDSTTVVTAAVGTVGYMVHGPYMPLAPAQYKVEFRLRRLTGNIPPSATVAVLDVVADGGTPFIARQEVRARDVPVEGWIRFVLLFDVTELRWTGQFHSLDFRNCRT